MARIRIHNKGVYREIEESKFPQYQKMGFVKLISKPTAPVAKPVKK